MIPLCPQKPVQVTYSRVRALAEKAPEDRPLGGFESDVGYCFDKELCALRSLRVYCPPFPIPEPCVLEAGEIAETYDQVEAELAEILSRTTGLSKAKIRQLANELIERLKRARNIDDVLSAMDWLAYKVVLMFKDGPAPTATMRRFAELCPQQTLTKLYVIVYDGIHSSNELLELLNEYTGRYVESSLGEKGEKQFKSSQSFRS